MVKGCVVGHGSSRILTYEMISKYGPTIAKGSNDYRRRQVIACVAISKAQGYWFWQ